MKYTVYCAAWANSTRSELALRAVCKTDNPDIRDFAVDKTLKTIRCPLFVIVVDEGVSGGTSLTIKTAQLVESKEDK